MNKGRKKKYNTEEERKEAKRRQTLESNKRMRDKKQKMKKENELHLNNEESSNVTLGNGILGDITKNIKRTYKKAIDKSNKSIKEVKEYANVILNGRNDYPPKVRSLLAQYGENKIKSAIVRRTPVPSLLTQALNAVSLGSFGKNLKDSPYDTLFHLSLVLTLDNDIKILIEKNEVINMEKNSSTPNHTDIKEISQIPTDLTVNEMLNKAMSRMGNKYFGYSARDNNCQDYILAILQANQMGNQEDYNFVKQNTKELFEGLTTLRKVSNTITDLGAKVNEITTGAGISKKNKKMKNNNNISTINILMPKNNMKNTKISYSDTYDGADIYGCGLFAGGAIIAPNGNVMMPTHSIVHHYGLARPPPNGGNVLGKIKKAFNPKKNGVAKAFRPDGPAEQFGKNVASTLIHQGIPVVSGVLGELAGEAMGPGGSMIGNQIGEQVGKIGADELGKATGYGVRHMQGGAGNSSRPITKSLGLRPRHLVKGSAEAKAYMASIRSKKKSNL